MWNFSLIKDSGEGSGLSTSDEWTSHALIKVYNWFFFSSMEIQVQNTRFFGLVPGGHKKGTSVFEYSQILLQRISGDQWISSVIGEILLEPIYERKEKKLKRYGNIIR